MAKKIKDKNKLENTMDGGWSEIVGGYVSTSTKSYT